MFLVPLSRRGSDLARSIDRLFDERFYDRLVATPHTAGTSSRSPALDVTESEQGYTVTLDLPGVAKGDVKVDIDGRRVSVRAQSEATQAQKEGDRLIFSERSSASYARSFTLPLEIDQTESSAKLDDGVLTLTLAKRGNGKTAQLTVN